MNIKHYENKPIQIYWIFYYQKNKNFQIKSSDIFIFLLKTEFGYSLEASAKAVLTSIHNLCFSAEMRKIM